MFECQAWTTEGDSAVEKEPKVEKMSHKLTHIIFLIMPHVICIVMILVNTLIICIASKIQKANSLRAQVFMFILASYYPRKNFQRLSFQTFTLRS